MSGMTDAQFELLAAIAAGAARWDVSTRRFRNADGGGYAESTGRALFDLCYVRKYPGEPETLTRSGLAALDDERRRRCADRDAERGQGRLF